MAVTRHGDRLLTQPTRELDLCGPDRFGVVDRDPGPMACFGHHDLDPDPDRPVPIDSFATDP